MLDAAQLVEYVQESEPGMAQRHPRTCVTHHHLRPLALRRLVAMDRATRAGRLRLAIRALLETALRIIEEALALRAGRIAAVVVTAIDADHRAHRAVLALQAGRLEAHDR